MPLSRLPANARGALLAIGAFAVFSIHDVVIKILGAHYSAVQIIFFSVLFAFPLFTLLLIRQEGGGSLRPRHPWWSALRTIAVVLTAFGAFTAFSLLPLAQTYALLFATPLIITLLSIPVLGERVGLHRGAAVLVGLIGVLIVLRPGSAPLSLGHLAGLAAAIGSATASIIVRKIGAQERAVVLLLYPLLANIVIMGAFLPQVYEPMPIEHIGALAALSVLSLAAAAMMIMAYRSGEAAVVAPMQYSQIIWAVLYGRLLFGETLDTPTFIGACVVIASGIYIVLRESRSQVSANQPVLNTRTRMETGANPRLSALMPEASKDRD